MSLSAYLIVTPVEGPFVSRPPWLFCIQPSTKKNENHIFVFALLPFFFLCISLRPFLHLPLPLIHLGSAAHQALLGQDVVLTLADGTTRTGTVYTVDPVNFSVALLKVREPPPFPKYRQQPISPVDVVQHQQRDDDDDFRIFWKFP